ncbi:hypothetical protein BK809_0003250 [Diplodia seriata]|uniref:Rho-GAP domain-containing protein n=1 Tax=Diplodia seriata TaxID=420778 RepID=A0A1S8BMP9_9PEZI|nr:hypothetical protein BK809_0003250 [Diplodia seriata]
MYRRLMDSLHPIQQNLLLYVLDFFRFFSAKAADMELLALRFINVFFRGPSNVASLFDGSDIRTLLSTIVFLIEHHNGIVSDENGNCIERIWFEELGPFRQRTHMPLVLLPATSETSVVSTV